MADYYVREEDGTSRYILEDGSGDLLTEGLGTIPFIASATVVYAPSVPEVTAPFIGSVTAVHDPIVAYTGGMPELKAAGTFNWLCPSGTTLITFEGIGGGGGGQGDVSSNSGFAAGGGGAYAIRNEIPVTPGTVYTFVVGAGGADSGGDGGSTTFTGDGSVTVTAVGGKHAVGTTHGAGGLASACTGDAAFNGGDGGDGSATIATGGAGGGASGNRLANGAAGTSATPSGPGEPGGTGANGGGSGGQGGTSGGGTPGHVGVAPGGGGGGGGGFGLGGAGAPGSAIITLGILVPFIGSVTAIYPPTVLPINVPFISSVSAVFAPSLTAVNVPFIPSVTVVYTPELPEVNVPFIGSSTNVWRIFSTFDPDARYSGPGNGGEAYLIRLNANGVTNTATLAGGISSTSPGIILTGDTGFPTTRPFIITIDDEQLYVSPVSPHTYLIRARGRGNTTTTAHSDGSTVSWGDSYDLAIVAAANIAHNFTANINSTGSFTYPGWLIEFDSSQAYLDDGSRYPMHVTEVMGVFAAGAGVSGSNRLDSSQPNAICTPTGASDHCPAALANPALIASDISTGDVAVVRYTNPESFVLDLGPRSSCLQSWFGLKRVDSSDADVTLTDPTGYVVDTHPSGSGPGPFTGSVNDEWDPAPMAIGIAPDASDAAGVPIATPNNVPWTTVTLPGGDRYFTVGSGAGGYDEKGWPICCLAVRQGTKRVPLWQSWDWHDYAYVYSGFGVDNNYAQILINRNGMVFDSVPSVELPGPQDIDGPDVVWDDGDYAFGASWYVAIFGSPYIVVGPTIGGTPVPTIDGGPAPGVTFPGGGGSGSAVTTVPGTNPVEGGSGGNIGGATGLHVWQTS